MLNIGLGEAHAAGLSLHNSSVAHDGCVILALYVEKAPSQWRVIGNSQFDGSKKHGFDSRAGSVPLHSAQHGLNSTGGD